MIEASFADSIKSVKTNKRKMPIGRNITGKVKIHKTDFHKIRMYDELNNLIAEKCQSSFLCK